MITLNEVKEIMSQEDDESHGDFIHELHYESAGNVIEFVNVEVPENLVFTVKEVNDEREYDSYGNSETENAFVVFSVSDGIDEVLYKLPGTYASYEGWNWDTSKIVEVRSQEKVVTTWEWKEV